MVLWYLPVFYEAALRHHSLHIVQHLVFLATSVVMSWPVLSPVPELPRDSGGPAAPSPASPFAQEVLR